jgi:site-specific recombinase XerD
MSSESSPEGSHRRPSAVAVPGLPDCPAEPDRIRALRTPRSFAPRALERAELEGLPAIVVADGASAMRRFAEFFAVTIRNRNTRIAYAQAVGQFLDFATQHGVTSLTKITPLHVAAYIESHSGSAPTRKQHLAAIRRLCDWLVTGQIIPANPAASVRGPSHVVDVGKTPILAGDEVRRFLDAIPIYNAVGLRDRALVGVLFFAGARISAALAITPRDWYREGRRYRLRLHEKGGSVHTLPFHHEARELLEQYVEATGFAAEPSAPIFRAAARDGQLTERPLLPLHAWRMIRRRARAADLASHAGCHTFRASAITLLRQQGATLEIMQRFANHKQPKTTLLYDRTSRDLPDAEVERIQI